MIKKSNKGFTLIELLATVTMLGILTGLAIQAYYRYVVKTQEKAYDFLANSAISATEDYLMNNPNIDQVDFDTLIEKQYLESAKDPADKENNCRGLVHIIKNEGDLEKLDKNDFIVYMCCSKKNITYRNKSKEETETCNA